MLKVSLSQFRMGVRAASSLDGRAVAPWAASYMPVGPEVAGVAVGFINELRFISRSETVTFSRQVAMGLAESLAPPFVGFGCLTVAWLCVTLGLWRRP